MKRTALLLSFLVACNQPPTAPQIVIEPAEPRSIDELNLVFEVESIDQNKGDVVSYDIKWSRNGTEVEDFRGERTIPAGRTLRGQTWKVEVVPSDGTLIGFAGTAEVTVLNSPPEIDSVALSPAQARTNDVLTMSYIAEDLDDDLMEETISWEINGMELSTTQRKISGIDYFDKNDEVQAFVTVNDGVEDSARVGSAVLVVDNTPPTVPEIALVPEEPRPRQHLYCQITADADDDDNDTITYQFTWTRDGRTATGSVTTEHPGDTVNGADLKQDEEWTCEVKASDGQHTSAAVSVAAIVKNATVPGFSGEEGPELGDYLQCEGYLDKARVDDIPKAWGDDCVDGGYNKILVACGASTSAYRYIEVSKNVFRDGLTGYPQSGLITAFRDQDGNDVSMPSNLIYATGNHPHTAQSWWITGNGCGESNPSLTVNNSCDWDASNCFGQGLTGDRYLWVYVGK